MTVMKKSWLLNLGIEWVGKGYRKSSRKTDMFSGEEDTVLGVQEGVPVPSATLSQNLGPRILSNIFINSSENWYVES